MSRCEPTRVGLAADVDDILRQYPRKPSTEEREANLSTVREWYMDHREVLDHETRCAMEHVMTMADLFILKGAR